uniref:Ectopic P-granules 5 autophagy tethering factor n=1 Tax=Meleagris gallopavo TaxID=9103 RepID=A0A803XLM9_MELGA
LSNSIKPEEKKKRSNEDSQIQEPDDVFLPPVSEMSSQAPEVQVEQPGEFTEIKLSDEAEHGKAATDLCDISLSNLTLASQGSLTAAAEPSAGGEESKAGPSHEECGGNVEKSKKSKLDKPPSFVEVVASGSENSDVLGDSFHSSAAASQAVVGIARGKETENVQDAKSPLVSFSEKPPLSPLQPCEKSKTRVHRLGLKSLYPDLSTELSYERPTIMAVKPLLHNERLYPELPTEPELMPFTREQLKIFEPCSWLENVDSYTEEFESVAHQDRHEFYELLLNYMRCRKQLLLAEVELQAMMTDCQNIKGRLGVCADQCKVTGHHRYQTVEMNGSVLGELKKLFEAKAEHVHQTLALHSYTSVLSRLQVESYVYRLLNSSSLLRSVALQEQELVSKQSENLSSDLSHLKECISVLFSFTRRVIEDPQFKSDLLMWLQRLVSVLQRIGCPGDHLFLFNHILRCPAGIGEWAVPFVQIKVLDNPSGVFHFMQSLALLMSPVKNRVEFMCHMKPNERKSSSSSGKESGNWTLVDEGGEEDEDPETSWILLLEDDLIVLLSQFPFHELFQHFLGFKSAGTYFPEKTTPQEMMKVFAFANSLVELLSVGLETFNRARYRQFVKRIGQLIKMTLCHVSDHWAQYVSGNKLYGSIGHLYSMDKLQLEFDELFFRAVLHVLKAKRLGVWLFMSEMPYGTLSSNMLWKLFFVMHCAESENLEKLCSTLQPADCKQRLEDPQHLVSFEKYLQSMNCSEEICLLTTFAQMAQTKRADVDEDFIKIIVLEIYEVSYVSLSTRETFSKVGRELLGAIASVHTQIISVLLDRVKETIERVGMVSLYLFKELPLYLWKPSSSEIALIRDWLLNYSLTTVENKLACIILEGLNWGLGEQDALHLDPAIHSEVALMVVEAYLKYLSQKPYAGLLSESIKQVSYLASIVRYGETPESSFNQWAWGLILRLKLHRNDRGIQCGWPAVPVSDSVLDMTESITLHPLLKAVKAGIPIGCYLALAMTTLGHSIEKFCAEGIPLLGVLVQSRHLRTVVHVLDKVLPIFYSCQYYLLKSEQFLSHVQLFLQLDSGVPQGMTQQVTHKVTQHLTGVSYGENVKLLNSMIQTHIFRSGQPNGVGPTAVLEFWVQVLISQQLWHRDQATLYLLDHLCKAAFQYSQEDCIQKLLYQQHKNALGYHCDKGLLSSLVSWIVAGNVTPSFVEGNANSSQVWFSWMVLNIESIFEEDSQLRRVVERELIINDLSPDQALKKAQTQLKLPVVPSLQRLMIYRWAHQALATPADHPLMPLIWQKFFLLYLHRPGPQYGLPVDGCIGRRFFQSAAHVNLLNEMKQRLTEVADFHHAASKALKMESPVKSSDRSLEKASCLPGYLTSPELHKELVRLCNVFILWLEEESFQKGDTYIPSLPKQYDAHRLAKIMQNQQDLWMEYVNIELIHHEFQEAINLWTQTQLESHTPAAIPAGQTDFTNPLSAKERIMNNLKKFDLPKPPLSLQPMKAPVPVISSASLINQKEAIHLTHTDLKVLQGHAKTAALWESQHVALNSEILDTLPKLYVNREEQITLHLECRGASSKGCQGAALVTIQFEGKHKNEAVSQQLHALRKEVRQLQAEATKPPSLGVVEAAVHVENFITTLINIYKVQPMPAIKKVGISLFFIVVEYVCDETQRNPPTRQFFTSCIEILGQVFISGTKSECKRLLQTILHNRRLCTLLSPYFTPVASPDEFVALYEKVVTFLSEDNSDVVFMLLTKLNFFFNAYALVNLAFMVFYPQNPQNSSSVFMLPSVFILLLIQLFPLDLDKLLPSHHGALWLHLMHYCGCCTAPKMPEFILYTFHAEFRRLPWKEMHPDQMLMEEFFKVERGSPKSCFLFLGYVLCEINWVSVLSDAWNPNPHPQTHNMIVCLLYMMVLLAKEEQLIGKEESPLINLLGQTSSLPWQLVGISSYQSIISYCNSHYPPSVILAKDAASELIVKLLKISAGFGTSSDSHVHLDATLKCQAYIRQVVQFLSTLEQSGKITLAALEQEMSKLLDDVVIFNPPDMDLQTRHLALSSLFTETLMMLNNSSVTTAESLRGSLRKWIDSKVHGLLAMPLLTAACQSLASVRHMAETTEACITSYFNKDLPHHQELGWGPVLASLQVPELTMGEFLQECLSLGSYLTLYVYLLQCLNTDQTLTNEMKILITISKWLEQVYPSSAKEEAKLFLWWHKAMQLSLIQMEQDDAIVMESVVRTLLSIQGRQSQLAEERLTSGILGAIGLGRRSPLSPRFRLVARSLSAFLLVQIPAEGQVRLKAGSEPKLAQKAQQALSALESMASNKQYMDFQEQISQASLFIKHPEHCLRDGNNLLAFLVNTLYPEVHYLDCIR